MKKLIPMIAAIVLILVIGVIAFGSMVWEKYSYSKERVDMEEYFKVSGDQVAIILQDEMIAEKAHIREGICYFELGTVHIYLNEIFYADKAEGLLLYTTAVDVYRVNFGDSVMTWDEGSEELGYAAAYLEEDVVYVAADYVKRFTNLSYEVFECHVQVDTQWDSRLVAEIEKDTAIRQRGGVKSPILRDLIAGEQVEILEKMDTWSMIKTSDSIIGYVENKLLTNESITEEVPVTDYRAPEYTSLLSDKRISLGWHSIGGLAGNATLDTMAAESNGLSTIAPTWFSLNDNEGNFRSFASTAYVERAHTLGLQVWGVWDDFNFSLETGNNVDIYQVLSVTSRRQGLVANIAQTAMSLGLDGINIDFEKIGADSGPHFLQFLRELSVRCRENGLVLSVDNYVPFNFNSYYRLDIQGQVADYVVIMGYDEHWSGSGDPGSVAGIDFVENGINRTLESVPAEKVVNALPFYSILWKVEGAAVTDEFLTIKNTADFLARNGIVPVWDDETCQNYAEWLSGNVTYKIWLEDEASINVKLNVMRNKNIGGVAVWKLGNATSGVWELISAYVNS